MIWITQWLCPQRHCSIGLFWDDAQETKNTVTAQGEAMYRKGPINRWCGICGSRKLKPEHAVTRFRSLEEGMPEFRRMQRENLATRKIIGEPTPLDPQALPYPNLLEDL
jgi:hypothetical protein